MAASHSVPSRHLPLGAGHYIDHRTEGYLESAPPACGCPAGPQRAPYMATGPPDCHSGPVATCADDRKQDGHRDAGGAVRRDVPMWDREGEFGSSSGRLALRGPIPRCEGQGGTAVDLDARVSMAQPVWTNPTFRSTSPTCSRRLLRQTRGRSRGGNPNSRSARTDGDGRINVASRPFE